MANGTIQGGEWWLLGRHLLYCGDSAGAEFVERATGAQPAFAFADPPYNAGVADWDRDFEWRHDWLADAARVVAVTPGMEFVPGFYQKTVMPYRWSIACHITNGMTRGKMGFSNWIYVGLFSRQSVYAKSQDVIRVSISPKDADGAYHKGRKPLGFLRRLLPIYAKAGDVVVDPFLGSGTTLIAAEELGLRCVGAEISAEYCANIIARWEARTGERAARVDA